jgi:hypothetical protein
MDDQHRPAQLAEFRLLDDMLAEQSTRPIRWPLCVRLPLIAILSGLAWAIVLFLFFEVRSLFQ